MQRDRHHMLMVWHLEQSLCLGDPGAQCVDGDSNRCEFDCELSHVSFDSSFRSAYGTVTLPYSARARACHREHSSAEAHQLPFHNGLRPGHEGVGHYPTCHFELQKTCSVFWL